MTAITLVFPHQLFEHHPAIVTGQPIVLIEDPLFFNQYNFHKSKIVLHRASMMHYKKLLEQRHFEVSYWEAKDHPTLEKVFKKLAEENIDKVFYSHTTDYLLERRLKRFAHRHGIALSVSDNPNFICNNSYLNSYFQEKKRYFLNEFYIEQRKRLSILLQNQEPLGGQWTYDTENRKKLPSSVSVPRPVRFAADEVIDEAREYMQLHFDFHSGSADHFNYPVTTLQAKDVLNDFLENRFENYGIYQDAIEKNDSKLFHSLLTPCLNIGLLTPQDVLQQAMEYGMSHGIPINSIEGFIRQILGWREFIRALYEREGVSQRTSNHWNHQRKIPRSFWEATTGIEPVDNVILKVLETGYCNHIERLMIMGNFMLLCEFNPNEVYCWFMELFIDSYDWVMVPNVYGMSQFADGGKMSTKPYISGSNYVLKMSNYKKGEWCEIWDALYWRFIEKHQQEFIRNPRMSMMVKQLEKMDAVRKNKLETIAENFLKQL